MSSVELAQSILLSNILNYFNLFSAVKSISLYRKDNLQSPREIMGDSASRDNQPVAKRQKIGSHDDRDQRTEDTMTQFEAGLYQVFGIILSSQRQYSDALHYYRLAAQLQPGNTMTVTK